MGTAASTSPEARLQMLRDLMDIGEIILRDREALQALEQEQVSLERRREAARRQMDEDCALYRDAVAALGCDPANILDGARDGATPDAAAGDESGTPAPTASPDGACVRAPARLLRPGSRRAGGQGATAAILHVLRAAAEPLDADEIATRSGIALSTVRPALTRLKQQGRVSHAGSRATKTDGRRVSTYRPASAAERRHRSPSSTQGGQ